MKNVNDVLKELDCIRNTRDQLEFCDDVIGNGIHIDRLRELLENYEDMLLALPIKK